MLIWIIIAWFTGTAIVGHVAMERGRGALGWAMLAILASPLVVLLALAALPYEKNEGAHAVVTPAA